MKKFIGEITQELKKIRESGLYKEERIISSPQKAVIAVKGGKEVLNFCSNNYLGLANHPRMLAAARETLDRWGFGMASVRFICGTTEIHKELERKMSEFLSVEDTILYAACFDANGGIFEPFMGPDSAILTDSLNHASIIDGIRLTKANRFIYSHSNMDELEKALKDSAGADKRLIVTDGVFSMDGDIALLQEICDLAERYDALVMVDDSHATGVVGKTGRGTPEHCGVEGRVDFITTTFGKALGGASGGCIAGRKPLIDYLRQKSRPYIFSNTIAPVVVGTTLAVLEMLSDSTELLTRLRENTIFFRRMMSEAGFRIKPGEHPIVPILVKEDTLAPVMANRLLEEGIYVIGFTHPVVPKGEARIRVQISAGHKKTHLEQAVEAFTRVGRDLKVIA